MVAGAMESYSRYSSWHIDALRNRGSASAHARREYPELSRRQHLHVGERQCRCCAQLQEGIVRQRTECGFIDVL
jgi:hypothetical protein